MTDTVAARVARSMPDRRTLLWIGLVLNAELLLVLVYLAITPTQFADPAGARYLVYPFIWINVGIWVLLRAKPTVNTGGHRHLASGVAGIYLVVLLAVSGGVSLNGVGTGFRVSWLPPGWGPALVYSGELLQFVLLPYLVVGYAGLSYLVYVTILDAARSVVSGVLGFFSCVSCTWPIAASVLTTVFGGSSMMAAAYSWSHDISTVVFLLTVGLLYWRPFGR